MLQNQLVSSGIPPLRVLNELFLVCVASFLFFKKRKVDHLMHCLAVAPAINEMRALRASLVTLPELDAPQNHNYL